VIVQREARREVRKLDSIDPASIVAADGRE
jgi:hypothetical protein